MLKLQEICFEIQISTASDVCIAVLEIICAYANENTHTNTHNCINFGKHIQIVKGM